MSLEKQFKNFDKNPKISELKFKEQDILSFYQIAKQNFTGIPNYNWSIKKAKDFVNSNNLNPSNFIVLLEYLFKIHFERKKALKGSKTAFDFIATLKSNPKFKTSSATDDRIFVSRSINIKDFLEHMSNSKPFLIISQKEMVEHIFKHYNTGYKYSTLYRMYHDVIKKN